MKRLSITLSVLFLGAAVGGWVLGLAWCWVLQAWSNGGN